MSGMSGVSLTLTFCELFERDIALRLPFRFGAVTLRHATQAFVRVGVRLADGREAVGASAELMVPKWFDKSPELSQAQNAEQLRDSLRLARRLALEDSAPATAFARFERQYPVQLHEGAALGLNPLVASFGLAQIDKAVLDGLCRALGVSFFDAMRRNVVGLRHTPLAPDLDGFDFDTLLTDLRPMRSLALRHTVGMADVLTHAGSADLPDDGLPATLEDVVRRYRPREFKLKLGGDAQQDRERLTAIASLLGRQCPDYRVTLDGNEQYADAGTFLAFWRSMERDAQLSDLVRRVRYVEQPLARSVALRHPLGPLASAVPMMIDESDETLDAFVGAKALGYRAVSSKSCKGLYKSLINRARCELWNAQAGVRRYFMTAEDLTCQAGLAVQQDLALAALLGVTHIERNGHHYVAGMPGAQEEEQRAFAQRHPALYAWQAGQDTGGVRLRANQGDIALEDLYGEGFASNAMPDWTTLREMQTH
ncbi:mandelate racemase [Pandoraea fibrosis]|uniref:Mandelate racemase n=1 Tax=Pandoraea fibrosis TaxID=1891094 RepID=A0A5E4XKV4_9BURK|nr:mandelate racemase [Pandoraea fibrosis]VVE37149.1 mandelate racemase [Pandoraea fibrosis]